jgi:ABC-type nitrate/sulfonate/bicarbonate transport system substrate-binding protein
MHGAVISGRCAAGYLTEPFYTPAKPDTRTLAWTVDAISKSYLGGGWIATTAWTRDHAEGVGPFAAAMRDAANWANRQPPAIAGVLVKYTGGDPATVASEARDVSPSGSRPISCSQASTLPPGTCVFRAFRLRRCSRLRSYYCTED